MNTSVVATFGLIVLARICDVTLDTVRTAAVIQGRKLFASVLGFLEAVIYVAAIAKVLLNMNHPIYALAYGLGYALGNFLGITIEQYLAFGLQVVYLFTRTGAGLARALTQAGYRVAEVQGHISVGDVSIVYVEVQRKGTQKLLNDAAAIDPTCFCVVNDVRSAGFARPKNNPQKNAARRAKWRAFYSD